MGTQEATETWRLGIGQTEAEERAEIRAALEAGRGWDYLAAQNAAARAIEAANTPSTYSSTAVEQYLRNADSRSLVSCPTRDSLCNEEDEANEIEALLRAHAEGSIDAKPAALPELTDDAYPAMRTVAEFAALVIGLHHWSGRKGHAMLAVRVVERHTGIPKSTASRALNDLVAAGVLNDEGAMPPLPGRTRGTRRFSAAAVQTDVVDDRVEVDRDAALDGLEHAPVDGAIGLGGEQLLSEGGAVPIEPAVEPAPKVADEVGLPVVRLHTQGGYVDARRGPRADELVTRALDRAAPGTRNDTGLWLACQLRDNGIERAVAQEAMLAYAPRVPSGAHPYTDREALRSLEQAYRRPPREPWASGSPAMTASSMAQQVPTA